MNAVKKLYLKFRIYSRLRQKHFPLNPNQKHCFIFLAADYGNIGDVAITFAQKQYLQKRFPEHEIIEVPAAYTLGALNSILRQIRHDDIITIIGGGNMGDMYADLELLRLMVVRAFRKNRIICFPQTIDYSSSPEANWLKRLSQKIYSSHPFLTMMAREQVSFRTMKSLYPEVDICLTPDIVMTLDKRPTTNNRQQTALFCLRNDREKSDNAVAIAKIKNLITKEKLDLKYTDTHIGGDRYSEEEKYTALNGLWDEFKSSRLVVTDRLHGMIFAYITGTPAIILPNSNFKVAECYHWIDKCGYIRMYNEKLSVIPMTPIATPETDAPIRAAFDSIQF